MVFIRLSRTHDSVHDEYRFSVGFDYLSVFMLGHV